MVVVWSSSFLAPGWMVLASRIEENGKKQRRRGDMTVADSTGVKRAACPERKIPGFLMKLRAVFGGRTATGLCLCVGACSIGYDGYQLKKRQIIRPSDVSLCHVILASGW